MLIFFFDSRPVKGTKCPLCTCGEQHSECYAPVLDIVEIVLEPGNVADEGVDARRAHQHRPEIPTLPVF